VGMLAELNPRLSYSEICQLLIRAEAGEPLPGIPLPPATREDTP